MEHRVHSAKVCQSYHETYGRSDFCFMLGMPLTLTHLPLIPIDLCMNKLMQGARLLDFLVHVFVRGWSQAPPDTLDLAWSGRLGGLTWLLP